MLKLVRILTVGKNIIVDRACCKINPNLNDWGLQMTYKIEPHSCNVIFINAQINYDSTVGLIMQITG